MRLMQAFASACLLADWPSPVVHPGDLDWWTRDAVPGGIQLSERIRLWFAGEADASDLGGWGWIDGHGALVLLIRPDLRRGSLLGQIVDWAGPQATSLDQLPDGPPKPLQVVLPELQTDAIDTLKRLGFDSDQHADHGDALVALTRPFESWQIEPPALEPGFTIRRLGSADIASRVACGRRAFPGSRLTAERYEVARGSTTYRPALDHVVIAPDGSVAAFALGWLDPVSLVLELEPVGVDPAWQRRGLGRAICLATIRAGIQLGATRGLIDAEEGNPASIGLYGSLGYEITGRFRTFQRGPAG